MRKIRDIKIYIKKDEETSAFIAVCDEIGLALEDKSYTMLLKRIRKIVLKIAKKKNINCTSVKIIDHTDILKDRAKKGNRKAYLRGA